MNPSVRVVRSSADWVSLTGECGLDCADTVSGPQGVPPTLEFDLVRRIQLQLVDRRIRDEIPDTLLLVQHPPTITRGRGLQRKLGEGPRGSVASPTGLILASEGHGEIPYTGVSGYTRVVYRECERGGDLTYHGPGQLVGYPIFKLDRDPYRHDIGAYLRWLESRLIQVLANWDLKGHGHQGATGVWVGDRKIASIGIAMRKWVAYHGFALNVCNDLGPNQLIQPCGFDPGVMVSLEEFMATERVAKSTNEGLLESVTNQVESFFSRFIHSVEAGDPR